jgi:hypothetical protein
MLLTRIKVILKFSIVYFMFFSIAIISLIITGAFFDIENEAGEWYEYLHAHYGLYDDRHKYDFNPALGDFLILWLIFLPFIISFLYFIIKKFMLLKYKTRIIK